MNTPGFWDDQSTAAKVSAEHARVSRRLDNYKQLVRDYDDARELAAMDGDMADEIARSLAPLRASRMAKPARSPSRQPST